MKDILSSITGITFWVLVCILSATSFVSKLSGQDRKPLFLGFQPGITRETFYEKNEFDVNVVPLVLQFPLGKRSDLRFTSLVNYHFGSEASFSDLGLWAILPVYYKAKEAKAIPSSGIYTGPMLGVGRNLYNKHYTITAGVEGGYMFPVSKRFTLNLALQLGGSYFVYDAEPNILRNHIGLKVNLGFWL